MLRTLEIFAHEVRKFLKKQANLFLILSFLNVCVGTFHISHVCISENVKGVLMRNLRRIIFMPRQILADFQFAFCTFQCNNLNFVVDQVIKNTSTSWIFLQRSKNIFSFTIINNDKLSLTVNCSDKQFSYGNGLNSTDTCFVLNPPDY